VIQEEVVLGQVVVLLWEMAILHQLVLHKEIMEELAAQELQVVAVVLEL
tara:strand:- start:254 stop:400 length:147 start_codon:yes stop_codon:yes gene_type:complete